MLDSATVTSARYVPVPARVQTNFCCRYVRLSPTPTAPPALHRVSSLSIEIVSRRRRLSIFETTRASHSSPTKASTSRGSSPRLKPSSRARSVEKCRVVPLTDERVGRHVDGQVQVPEQLPLAAAVAGCEHDSLDGVLLEARHVGVDASRDLHRLEEAQAARLELVELRPRPDGRVAELRRVLRPSQRPHADPGRLRERAARYGHREAAVPARRPSARGRRLRDCLWRRPPQHRRRTEEQDNEGGAPRSCHLTSTVSAPCRSRVERDLDRDC